ncbi:MAG: hypothetical protein MJ252_04780 [archaeon]|nr:hypothetical protein [archaeon]
MENAFDSCLFGNKTQENQNILETQKNENILESPLKEEKNPFALFYNDLNININFPLTYDLLNKLFSPENIKKILTEENKETLLKYLPEDIHSIYNSPKDLSQFLLGNKIKFFTPMEIFYKEYNNKYFSFEYQSKLKEINEVCLDDYISKYNSTLKYFQRKLNESNSNEQIISFDMHSELASSGYSSADSCKDQSFSSGGFEITENTFSKKKRERSFGFLGSENKSHKDKSGNNFKNETEFDYTLSERFKLFKKNKNMITIPSRTKEEIANYRKQEKERYKHPELPWEYSLPDGRAIVAPVFKRFKNIPLNKARDHALLKQDRPSYITILSLVRDATSKLLNGVGTRADICDLIKDSQYINENCSENIINNVVSGALDRLHYEKDPCVKYDLHQKLWIYLHRERTLDYHGWKCQDDDGKVSNIEEDDNSKYNEIGNNPNWNPNIKIKNNHKIIIVYKSALKGENKNEIGTERDEYFDSEMKNNLKVNIDLNE